MGRRSNLVQRKPFDTIATIVDNRQSQSPGSVIAMTIELTKEARENAIASLQRYFDKDMEDPIGNVAAGALLGFFLEEIGPVIYNKAVADVQERLLQRISELDFEVHEEEFQYWKKFERKPKSRK
jgi:uncharacterized protein (DUF2164 family)